MINDNTEKRKSVLVTGSTGFLGSRIVKRLIDGNFHLRALVREKSRTEKLASYGVDEIYRGDISDISTLMKACEGMDYVVHAAADTVGTVEGGKRNTVEGTVNILEASRQCSVKKLIYISSCSVYGVSLYEKNAEVTEDFPLEPEPEQRGAYSHAKFMAEQVVMNRDRWSPLDIVCLRPGTIIGPGGQLYSPMMGFSLGNRLFLTIGDGSFVLPFVYVDNVADAVLQTLMSENSSGKIYNLIDQTRLTKKNYLELCVRKVFPQAVYLNIPYRLLYLMVYFQEIMLNLIGKKPFLTRYRLISSQKEIIYNGEKIQKELDWSPPVSMEEALGRITKHEFERKNLFQENES